MTVSSLARCPGLVQLIHGALYGLTFETCAKIHFKVAPSFPGGTSQVCIDDDIEEDIMTITSDRQALKEASKNIEIKVEVDKGMMTTARNKLIDAIFMKTPKLDPHSFAIEFEEYNGETTTFDADYFEVKIKSINPKTELKKFVLKEIKLSVYDIDDQTVLEEACIDDKINS